MKHTLTEARAELEALKACSNNEAAVNYNVWMNTYLERLMHTTEKVHEIYMQCAELLQDKAGMKEGCYDDRYEDDIW